MSAGARHAVDKDAADDDAQETERGVTPRGAPGLLTGVQNDQRPGSRRPATLNPRRPGPSAGAASTSKRRPQAQECRMDPVMPPMANESDVGYATAPTQRRNRKGKERLREPGPHGIGGVPTWTRAHREFQGTGPPSTCAPAGTPWGAAAESNAVTGSAWTTAPARFMIRRSPLPWGKAMPGRQPAGKVCNNAAWALPRAPQPAQVIRLLVPDPTVLREKLPDVQQSARQTDEDSGKRRGQKSGSCQ